MKQHTCKYCGAIIPDDQVNAYDYIIACEIHKAQADADTEKFFAENPDYTKWPTLKQLRNDSLFQKNEDNGRGR